MEAQTNLGLQYYRGEGVAKDLGQAAQWFLKAGRRNEPTAQYLYGNMCLFGEHFEKNYPAALNWLRASAKNGDTRAEGSIGYMYENGFGLPQDRQEAIARYLKAADAGDAWSREQLDRLGVRR